jgi:hypothetical protein
VDFKKLELTSAPKDVPDPDAEVTAIIKVNRGGYVPEGVQVRARVDETIFTAALKAGSLQQLEDDPDVASVALSKPLAQID